MNRTILTALAVGSVLFAGQPAQGQSLSDRIDHVMNKRASQEANNATKARMLGALLYTDLSVQFDETPARDAIEYLRGLIGVNIVGRYNDDRTGIGIDPDLPITLDVQARKSVV